MRMLVAGLLVVALLAGCAQHAPPAAPAPTDVPVPAPPPGVTSARALPPEFQAGFAALSVPTGFNGGEPNIGVTSKGNAYVTALQTIVKSSDGGMTWKAVVDPTGPPTTEDPMLWVDPLTDRIFNNQLYVGCSYLSFSDDEGATWTPSPASCGLPGIDHQKVATGPYPAGAPQASVASAVYPDLASYCYNKVTATHCAVSFDGGLHYEYDTLIDTSPLMPSVDTNFNCGGLNGHQHHAADGTIYLPYGFNCGQVFVAVSTDGGISWTRHRLGLPSLYVDMDVASTPDGMVYLLYKAADQRQYMVRSKDHFDTFQGPFMVSPPEVSGTEFTVITAGSDGRVAFAYLGNAQNGNNSLEDYMPDDTVWNLYLTMTLDGESDNPTFVTTQANAPHDPVQRGSICMNRVQSTQSGCKEDPDGKTDRNLLDFIDMTVGPDGRAWVVYTDGCVSKDCVRPGQRNIATSHDAVVTVAHQTVGPSLFADKPAFTA